MLHLSFCILTVCTVLTFITRPVFALVYISGLTCQSSVVAINAELQEDLLMQFELVSQFST